ncbi:MAG: imelysin family protein [Bacteroidota bacterium]
MKNFGHVFSLAIALMCMVSCASEQQSKEVIQNYAALVLDNYEAARQDAVLLKEAIGKFTTKPSEATHQAAKDAWKKARESYGITEVFRFQEGPIDVIEGEEGPEARLNAWPLDESYIDYVEIDSTAGIINAPSKTLDKASLTAANESGGEKNISIGYHAIEFLLWGQDLSPPGIKQAGSRPHTDFVDGGTAANQDRRRVYLQLCADLLLDDLQLLIDQWKEGGAYRNKFFAMEHKTALSKMMTGMATLAKAELAGERIFVAYDNQDQEDEHSCFSDNTHRDTRLNLQGIKNVYFSLIQGKENQSIHDLVQSQDTTLAREVSNAFELAEQAVNSTAIPFDFAITADTERPKVLAAVEALEKLGDKVAEAGAVLNVKVGME